MGNVKSCLFATAARNEFWYIYRCLYTPRARLSQGRCSSLSLLTYTIRVCHYTFFPPPLYLLHRARRAKTYSPSDHRYNTHRNDYNNTKEICRAACILHFTCVHVCVCMCVCVCVCVCVGKKATKYLYMYTYIG